MQNEKPPAPQNRMEQLKARSLFRVRSHEERESLSPAVRVAEAVKRCRLKNFDDLDYLMEIGGAGRGVGTVGGDHGEMGELMSEFREATGVKTTADARSLIERWKLEKKQQADQHE